MVDLRLEVLGDIFPLEFKRGRQSITVELVKRSRAHVKGLRDFKTAQMSKLRTPDNF